MYLYFLFVFLVFAMPANAQFLDKLAILLVANSASPNAAELAIEQRLFDMEFDVIIIGEADASDDIVLGADILLISATVVSGTVSGNMPGLATYDIPIINWEPALYDEMGFTAGNGAEFAATELEIIDADHPLAAGLPADFVTFTTAATKQVSYGDPIGDVSIIAVNTADATQVALFGYETGAEMLVGTAPARRIGSFLLNDVADALSDEGWDLFDASIVWAMADPATSVSDNGATVPLEYTLADNFPNPFNPATKISFSVPKQSQVKLTVWNALGEQVATLVNEVRTAGEHTVSFDAGNVPSGVYFYRFEAGNTSYTKKMLFLK
jgi:hypothetical protein